MECVFIIPLDLIFIILTTFGVSFSRNGGWCMHDEAAVHYIDMIDQTTLGHRMIKKQFNKTPRAGWQIDPFGHSAVQAYLLGAEVILTSHLRMMSMLPKVVLKYYHELTCTEQ